MKRNDRVVQAMSAHAQWEFENVSGIISPQQPNRRLSTVGRDGTVVLRNLRGELGRYVVLEGSVVRLESGQTARDLVREIVVS